MREIVVISGKGGTGKTSLTASFAALANKCVLADCDVDAADLHLILQPKTMHKEDFTGGYEARILQDECIQCGNCHELCRFDGVIQNDSPETQSGYPYEIDAISCEGCGVCAYFCPEQAIEMIQPVRGELYISNTRYGPMVHARLGIAADNSGKLVALVRNNARKVAKDKGLNLIIIDGSPGVGCPVISSLTGADLALIVTEPTVSGIHDLERIAELTRHFRIPTAVCINKWDLNSEMTENIINFANAENIKVLGKIRYDNMFTKAQIMGASVVEYSGGAVAGEIIQLWERLEEIIS